MLAKVWKSILESTEKILENNNFLREIELRMTYENYKKGMFRVFIVLSIPLELVTYFQYDLSFTNKFFYSLEILSQTLVIFWCIYLISLLVAKPFIGFLGKS